MAGWAELHHPERRVRVFLPGGAPAGATGTGLAIEVVPSPGSVPLGAIR